jgi:hypothetical protein
MNRAAVLIGVNRVKGLPALNDAVRGAQRMHDWVLTQGFAAQRVVLITDESTPVKAANVQEAIGKLLDPMAGTEQLLIYFAGHGLNINYGEFWLLSSALEWPTESVDVARSAVLARYSNVPHVVFVSDACRTAAAGVQQQFITGSPIFPAVGSGSSEKAVDQFFACTLGNPALEVQAQDADSAGTFSALYTDALLEVLGGGEPTIIEVANDGETPDGVIRPWPLKRVLREKVSRRLIDLNLHTRAFQTPDARITSDPGQAWIARLAPPPPPPPPPAKPRPRLRKRILDDRAMHDLTWVSLSRPVEHAPSSLPDWVDAMLDKTLGRGAEPGEPPDPTQSGAIVEQAARHSEEFEPRHFETRCGIKLRGGKAVEAIGAAMRVEWLVEGEILRAHPASPQAWDRVLLTFADGSGAVVPLLPEFIAELSFDNGVWVDLAYEVSEFSPFHEADPAKRAERRYLREFVAAAVERGVFQPDRETLAALAARVFETPLPDPVLLLYLAYALDDAGMVGQLREMVSQMQARGAAPLFDVALLAYRQGDEQDGLLNATPGMPLLARGWAGLAARGIILPDAIAGVSQMLQPGLWTRFSAAAVSVLSKQLIPMEASHA